MTDIVLHFSENGQVSGLGDILNLKGKYIKNEHTVKNKVNALRLPRKTRVGLKKYEN